MEITSNYSITRSFITKEVKIKIIDNNHIDSFTLLLRPIKDFFLDENWNIAYHLISAPNYKNLLMLKENVELTSLQALYLILFNLGAYDKFRQFYTILLEQLTIILPELELDTKNKKIKINNLTITDEIWEYIVYLVKLSYGEKVEKPLSFDSPEAREFYLAQKAQEEKIARLKAKNAKNQDENSLSKIMLSITYAFPSITIDYLWNQTMAQIQWLQKYAAGSVSYEVNAKAFAAGNMKKGKKLDFFIK